jgi:hypothetical protein
MDNLALASFLREDYAAAVEWARRSDHMHGDMPRCVLLLTASYSRWENWLKLAIRLSG